VVLLLLVPDVGVPGLRVDVGEVVAAVDPVVGPVGAVPCDCEPVSSVPLDWMLEAVDRVRAQAPRPMSTMASSTATVGRASRRGPRRTRWAPVRVGSDDDCGEKGSLIRRPPT
jgi:hypothetical protein